MSTHIINFPGADIHTTTLTSVSNVSVGENLDVTSNLTVSGDTTVSGNVEMSSNLTVSGDTTVSGNVEMSSNLTVSGNATVSGNVGVGTTEPTETLDIVGNLNLQKVSNTASIKLNSNVVTEYTRSKKLIKYPRVALTSAASNAYENGYKVTYSHQQTDGSYQAWQAFDNDPSDTVGWYSDHAPDTYYNGTGGAYSGTTQLASETELGEWIGLEVPSPVKLYDVRIVAQNYSATTNTVDDFVIYAKKQSGDTWTNLGKFTGIAARQGSAAGVTVNVNSSDYYKFFALVATKRDQQDTYGVSIRVLDFFGTPEYDPDADGTDVIVRSVPNVPNTDWLELYYDGQDYTSMPSTVTDKSGNGVTGTPNGGVGFDTEYKAFTFDGVDDYVSGQLSSIPSADFVHSVSVWVKFTGDTLSSSFPYVCFVGDTSGLSGSGLYLAGSTNENPEYPLHVSLWTLDYPIQGHITTNEWYHVAFTYPGGGWSRSSVKAYINGVRYALGPNRSTGTENSTATFTTTNVNIRLATTNTGSSFEGSVANFRLFNRALTGDEVWQLYACQKEYFGHGNLGMTLKAGRLGIGTTEPRAVLDVRGPTKFSGTMSYSVPYYFARQANTGSYVYDEPIVYNNQVKTNYPDSFYYSASNNGYYKPPLPGVYQIHMTAIANGSGNIHIQKYNYINNTVILNHDDTHFNFTSGGWESVSASALILIDDPATQGIRIYGDGTGGDGIWAYGTYHGVVSIVWVSDI